jgi:glycosyltransferase involved in cell wall biosynthesis
LKILEINTESSWRGGERQTYLNMVGLRDAGVQISLLAKAEGELSKKSQQANFQTYEIKNRWEGLKFLAKNGSNFDVIHAQTSKAQLLAILTKPFHGKPVVYSRRVNFPIKGFMTKLKYYFTDKVVAITEIVKQSLEDFGIKNVCVITDIVENQIINSKKAKDFILENGWQNKRIIATVAAFTEEKAPQTLVQAIAILSKLRDDFVFLHFGEGKLKTVIEENVNSLKINNLYKFVGYHDNIQDFYSVFDIFVLTSQQEGLGSSILDAFINQVPVVATKAGGITETVMNQGLLCEVGDSKTIAESIHRLLNDGQLRKDFTEKAYQIAVTKHSTESVSKAYLKVFSELLS